MNNILRISLLLLLTLCVGSACAEVQQIDLVCEKYTGPSQRGILIIMLK